MIGTGRRRSSAALYRATVVDQRLFIADPVGFIVDEDGVILLEQDAVGDALDEHRLLRELVGQRGEHPAGIESTKAYSRRTRGAVLILRPK